MAYIGNIPAVQYASFSKQTLTADSSTVAFTLDNAVANENEIEVFVNNVRQEPGSGKAYTASGTTLTMSAAPTTGDSFYVIFQGKATQTVTAPAGSVTTSQLADGQVTNDKLQNSSITLNGSAVSLGGSATVGGTNTPAFFVRNESNLTFSSGVTTQISFTNEVFDTDSAFASNGFTVPAGQGGKYFFYFTFCYINPNSSNYRIVYIVKNGGNVVEIQTQGISSNNNAITGSALLDLSAGDFIDLDFYQNSGSNVTGLAIGGNGLQFGGYKIIT